MALADLNTALAAIDAAIAAYDHDAPISGSIEGLSFTRPRFEDLLARRAAILEALASDPSAKFDFRSRVIPR